MRPPANLTKLLNQSGFPLQMAIERLVDARPNGLGWTVFAREYGWRALDRQSGFIDLVLEDDWKSSVLAIEGKRVVEADWLFLLESVAEQVTTRTRLRTLYPLSESFIIGQIYRTGGSALGLLLVVQREGEAGIRRERYGT